MLVTGSTGFLGRAFVTAAVEAGHEVVAEMRRRSSLLDGLGIETVLCDVRDLDRVELPGDLDALVNFATGSEGDAASMAAVASS